jgi:nucleoside-diphosphate-sugar epimerase
VEKAEAILHLAARINVQDSIDDPRDTFESDVLGSFELLELARPRRPRFLFMSTCMVYARALEAPIGEDHPTLPASPYAASKLAAEALTLSYGRTYGLPATVVRPFNTYGPFQKSTGEGGVVSVFCARARAPDGVIEIYGDGAQTRDLLYVEDCARFTVEAALSDAAVGEILNAGTGRDVAINDLAAMIQPDASRIKHVPHIHPQSEIMKLQADASRAARLLGWKPRFSLEEGIACVKAWLAGGSA